MNKMEKIIDKIVKHGETGVQATNMRADDTSALGQVVKAWYQTNTKAGTVTDFSLRAEHAANDAFQKAIATAARRR